MESGKDESEKEKKQDDSLENYSQKTIRYGCHISPAGGSYNMHSILQ